MDKEISIELNIEWLEALKQVDFKCNGVSYDMDKYIDNTVRLLKTIKNEGEK